MKKNTESKEELDSYIESVKASQKNVIWPDVLRGGRSVDELLWKGARDAPLVQRIGTVMSALAYLIVGAVLVSIAVEQGSWFTGAFAAILFGVGDGSSETRSERGSARGRRTLHGSMTG